MSDIKLTIPKVWEEKGLSPEKYAKTLETRLLKLNEGLKDGNIDSSLVKSTVKETLEFLAWASIESELQKSAQLLKTMLREDTKRHGTSKRDN